MNAFRSSTVVVTILLTFPLASGCATGTPDDAVAREQAVQHSEQRLAQREHDLERARKDLEHFRTTRRHLREHNTRWGIRAFDAQVTRLLDERIDPLLANEWQSTHPELARLDLDLRLLRAAALLDLNRRQPASQAVREIARHYEGQEQMLVSHPAGGRDTLEKTLASLQLQLKTK